MFSMTSPSSSAKKYDFSGKVALVTGSSSGIGAAIAVQLARYGARVTITGRNAESLKKVADEIETTAGTVAPLQILGDLSDETLPQKLIAETIAHFGRLDVLVNNAGMGSSTGHLGSAACMSEFDRIFKVNVRSVVALMQLAVPHLEKTSGSVLNISSTGGMKPFGPYLVYSTSKAALDMITKTAALELGPKGIRVNSISPGPVATNFGTKPLDEAAAAAKAERLAKMTVLGRVASAEDIANLAIFLVSDEAVNITGSLMVNDGGLLIK